MHLSEIQKQDADYYRVLEGEGKMNSNGLNEHWTASEARKKREIAIRKDERMKVLDKAITEYDRLAMEGWNVWKFKEILESLRGEP